ncbi:MAG: EAL domain-containing protein [Actinomycetota bacterium]|nr:EAL domain-containing protein [Actinomycetota bacterium]
MDASVKQKRRWLIEFGLISFVPVLLLWVYLSQTLADQARDRAIASARAEARLVTDLALRPALGDEIELEPGKQMNLQTQAALDRSVLAARAGSDVARLTVRDRTGTVVWADDHTKVGERNPPGEAAQALVGNSVSKEIDLSKNPSSEDASLGRVLKIFVPVRQSSSAPPTGSSELWIPYAGIAQRIEEDTRTLYIAIGFGLLLVWGSIIAIVAGASQRLRRQAAEKEEQALSDDLTGLPNRTMFANLVESTIASVSRRKKMGVVMLMDLDRFKDVNDTLGHHNGDLLLQRIGSRLHSVLRETETVARLGGDEFAILLPEIADRQSVVPVVRRVLKVLEEPVVVGGLALQCEGSLGIAVFPEHGKTVDSVMRAADVAMYMAKENRSGYEFYDVRRHEHRHDAGRLALIGELRRAMDETELVLYYQPKVNMRTGRAEGVEALARWHHPERGLLSPDEFIPLAERSNLLRPMTLYLLDSALRQANAWRTRGLEVSVAVNLSMQNLIDLRLPNDLARLLTSWRLPPGSLELEITESTIMADHRRAMTILTRLNKMGVALSVDDFGTGYSSLAYLQNLPVDFIKIDKSFCISMGDDPGNATIVQSTIDLGHNLGLKVVAEGVETVEAYNKLAELGCDYAQGYFLSRPLAPDKATAWLEVMAAHGAKDDEAPPTREDLEALTEWVLEVPDGEPVEALEGEPVDELEEPAVELDAPPTD